MSAGVKALRWGPRLAGLGFLAAVVVIMQLIVGSGLISSFLVPTPIEIAAGFGRLFTEERIVQRFAMTGAETLVATLLAVFIGGFIGWALHQWQAARLAYTSWLVGLSASPSLLLYPLLLVISGRNPATIVVLGALSALPPVALKVCEGLSGTKRVLLDVGRSFDLTPFQLFRLIQFPAAMPATFAGIRIGLINALITVVGVEYLIGYGGLGALIPDLADRFEIATLYGAIIFVILASACFQLTVRRLEQWLSPI